MVTSSIVAKPGRDLVLKMADPAVSPSSYVSVAGLRSLQININNNPVDITNFDSQGFREWLADGGTQSYQLTGEGIFASGNTGFDRMNSACINRVLTDVQIVSGHGDSYLFAVVIMTLQRQGNVNDAETFNVTMESHGAITYVPAP